MVPEIKKILFATDLTKQSRHAFDYAVSIAHRYSASITVLYVMEELSQSTSARLRNLIGEERWQQLKESHERQAREILIGKKKEGAMIKEALDEFCREAEKEHAECEYIVDDVVVSGGIVVDEILHEAQRRECDLIVMGYHVRGKFEEAILGSTTRRVLRRSKLPVMLVRLPEANP